MTVIYYLSHPEVTIDPAVPVPDWALGRGASEDRAVRVAAWLLACRRIVSSAERKAVETAELIAEASAAEITVRPAMHENDRSATGFLVPAEFEQVANAFFAQPADRCAAGRVPSTPRRGSRPSSRRCSRTTTGPCPFSSSAMAVGTLLYCRHAGLAIDRRHDQPEGGSVFALDARSLAPLFTWRPMEEVERVLGPC
ncbi:MAG: hypothetical protein R3C69_12640 [Geminicoccaceae bacterium]